MPGRIFINYRRGDDPGYTQALYQRLEAEFGREALFMDVEGYIKAGDDFVHVLDSQVALSDVILAVIGPRWIDAKDETGRRRLDNPDDFVRIEIASALEQKKRIIPVLVGGAPVPRAEDLPEPLKPLARRNAVRLTHERFPSDCAGLVKDLKDILAELEAAHAAKTGAERHAAEEAVRRQQEEEAARAAEAQHQGEARAREQAAAGLSAEEIRKAEELANWDFIKGKASVRQLRDHIARYPAGVTQPYAMAALESLTWSLLISSPVDGILTASDLETFIAEFPDGAHAQEAKGRLEILSQLAANERAAEEHRIRETEAWATASTGDLAAVRRFLQDWPSGEHTRAAKARIWELGLRKFSVIQVVLLLVASAGIGFGIVYGAWKLGMLEGSPVNLVYMALVSAGVFVALYLLRKSASRNS